MEPQWKPERIKEWNKKKKEKKKKIYPSGGYKPMPVPVTIIRSKVQGSRFSTPSVSSPRVRNPSQVRPRAVDEIFLWVWKRGERTPDATGNRV